MAIWSTRRRISTWTPGRPRRGDPYVHLRAINSRGHRRIVSGVTNDVNDVKGKSFA